MCAGRRSLHSNTIEDILAQIAWFEEDLGQCALEGVGENHNRIHGGETGYRIAATLAFALLLHKCTFMPFTKPDPDEYMIIPEYANRAATVGTARWVFKHVLDQAGLKYALNGNAGAVFLAPIRVAVADEKI